MSRISVLWTILLCECVVEIANVAAGGLGFNPTPGSLLGLLALLLPVVLVALHSSWTLTPPRGILFLLLAATAGLAFEIVGLRFETMFGGQYHYHAPDPALWGVPVAIVLYWAVFIYTGYSVVTSFLCWQGRRKPDIRRPEVGFLGGLVLLDGLVTVAIDLFLDPLQVRAGHWSWTAGGPYFGVPIGNFVGWFFVTVLVTGIFRTYEYCRPRPASLIDPPMYLLSVTGYGMICGACAAIAMHYRMAGVAVAGCCVMLPILIANAFVLAKQRWERACPRHSVEP